MSLHEHTPLPAPTPHIDAESKMFWQATLEGLLLLGYCEQCLRHFWYPRQLCPLCGEWGAVLRPSAGVGTIHSYTHVRNGIDEYAGLESYTLGYVKLAEGPQLLTNLVEFLDEPVIGGRVEVVFHRTAGLAALPRFRPSAR